MDPGSAPGVTRRLRLRPLAPPLVAVLLAWSGLRLGYLWDDFIFLRGVPIHAFHQLLPDPADPFYRPIPRQLYFTLLASAGSPGALLGHAWNALLLAGVVMLLGRTAERLAGPRAGTAAGLAFAALGAVPFLVAWVSGAQDLFAMLFLLSALHFEISNRTVAAWIAAALALLSKETAAVTLPALAVLPWALGRGLRRTLAAAARYGLLVAAWAFIHPGIRTLLAHRLASGVHGYVGLEHPARWLPYAGDYLLTLLNVPATGLSTPWPKEGLLAASAALALAAVAILAPDREPGSDASVERPGKARVLLVAALLALPPLAIATMMVRTWAPYYAVLPALGTSLAIGVALARRGRIARVAIVAAFLALGVWSRGAPFDAGVPCERNLRLTADAVHRVESGLLSLHPDFPPRSRLLIAVHTPTTRRVFAHVYYYQAPRIWYRDPTLRSMRPDWREPGSGPEYLFFVAPDFSVREIDLTTLAVLPAQPAWDPVSYRLALRLYARGLAATGDTDAGVGLLLRAQEPDSAERAVNRRLAAMLRLEEGRRAEAEEILRRQPPVPREAALALVTTVLENPAGGQIWDDAALEAFGIQLDDAEACRILTQNFAWSGRRAPARRFAGRLLRLRPGDPDAGAALRYLDAMPDPDPISIPAPYDPIARRPPAPG